MKLHLKKVRSSRELGFHLSLQVLCRSILLISILTISTQASTQLERYVKKNPDDLEAVFKLASTLYKNNQHKKALKYWRHLASNKRNSKNLYRYARGLLSAENGHEALRICDRIKDQDYKSKCSKIKNKVETEFPEQYQLYEATLLIRSEKFIDAKDIIEALIEDDDSNPHYRLAMGRVLHGLKKYDYAHDHYLFVNSKLKNKPAKKALAKLKAVGLKAAQFVKQNKTSVNDEKKFYWRVYLSFKLASENAENNFRGLKTRAMEFYRSKTEEDESFDNYYRLGFLESLQGDQAEAKTSYENALDNSENFMYVIVEFLINELGKNKDKTEYVLNIMNEVGGEEIYRKLQQAAMAQDKSNRTDIAQEANSTMKKLGINSQKQFVAEFENYKRRISNAGSSDEKKRLLAEFKEKFKPILNNPSLKGRLKNLLNSDDAKKLEEKYGSQINKLKNLR